MRSRVPAFLVLAGLILGSGAFLSHRPALPPSRQFDVLIRGGTVVDGTGAPGRRADVGISGDRITAIGDLAGATAARTVDAAGLTVAPGFIDMLGWSQFTILVDGRGVSKVTQGITTELTGEGWSPAPVNANTLRDDSAQFAAWGLTVDWRDLDGYYRRLERSGTPFNVGTFVGATTVRLYVMGDARRAPTAAELRWMVALVDTAMRQGALGLSTSLGYPPATWAATDELVALARAAGRHGGLYITHIRSEGDGIDRALGEAFPVGERAGVSVEVWHLKLSSRRQWGRMPEILRRFEERRARGERVGANSYPYIASARGLASELPDWVEAGGTDSMLARLRDPAVRRRVRAQLGSLGHVMLLSTLDTSLRRWQGRRITEIARELGKAPADVLMDIVIADRGNSGAAYFNMSEDDVRATIAAPWVGVGSDFGATAPDGPLYQGPVHPRAYGTFPRILARYVREQRVLPLEAAVHKMTGVPAERMGLRERGLLREGWFADVTVFDPATVEDRATFEDPHRMATGVRYVLVNGRFTLDDGRLTAERPGRPLRGPGWEGR